MKPIAGEELKEFMRELESLTNISRDLRKSIAKLDDISEAMDRQSEDLEILNQHITSLTALMMPFVRARTSIDTGNDHHEKEECIST